MHERKGSSSARRITSEVALRAHAEMKALDRKLEHLPEAGTRIAVVREVMLGAETELAAACVIEVLERPASGPSALELLRDSLLVLLAGEGEQGFTYESKRAFYEAAHEADAEDAARLLRSASMVPMRVVGVSRLSREVAEIPLGRRRALAKEGDVALLEKLALDSDARVIVNLLDNPRLRESDVVRMAALRPVAESTLLEIGSHRRFGRCLHVRIALARNPYSPLDLAFRMLASLPLPEVREMAADPDIHPATKEQVRAELERRGAVTPPSESG